MVEHDLQKQCFSTIVDGFKAFLSYSVEGSEIDVNTTQVPNSISGRGIASTLMKEVVTFAKEKNLTFKKPQSCSYAQSWLERH